MEKRKKVGMHEKISYNNPRENLEKGEDPIHSFDLIVEGAVIGKAEVSYYSKPFPLYQISELYVDFEQQNKGYAGKIMEQVEEFLKKKGKAGVLVDAIDTESGASGMYERRGWQKVPGETFLYAYNLPAKAKVEDLKGYSLRYRDLMERPGFNK